MGEYMSTFADQARKELAAFPNIESSIKEFFLSGRAAIIYGAGDQARLAVEFCHYFGKKVKTLAISPSGKRTLQYYKDIPCHVITELVDTMERDQYDVLVAVHEKYNSEIFNALNRLEFPHIFICQNWEYTNEALRNMLYDSYLTYHGVHFHYDEAGQRFAELLCQPRPWRFYFSREMDVEKINLTGVLCDTLLPSLFHDCAHVCEGPYEWGPVALQPDDVVFDLGANMGLFASVAAARGCRVHAFEPTPQALELMNKNLSFYENISVYPLAVTDHVGTAMFYINDASGSDKAMTLNSLYEERGHTNAKLEIQTTSLDTFVDEHHIEKVDFIKADIEGAERFMLAGAQRTLARFAPKLALCTYHLPDDPEVMEQLILQANPHYVVEHKWSKLYAYCP